jgi:lipoate synthase
MDKHTYEDVMSGVRHNVETVRNLLHKIEDGKNYVDELEYHTRELRKIFEYADISGLADRDGNIVPPEE